MQVASLASTSSEGEEASEASAGEHVSGQRACWLETTYTTVDWDYPSSPAAYHDALLSRGASQSRFLRIAYSSTRERSNMPASCCSLSPTPTAHTSLSVPSPSSSTSTHSTLTTSLTRPSDSFSKWAVPPPPLRRTHVYFRSPSSTNVLRSLKRWKPLWPKPPHYHGSLLRSPLSRRKGLFRTVLAPSKAIDFFRWDIILGSSVSRITCSQEQGNKRSNDLNTCLSLHVAESVLAPYEAGAGFFGWHGLGLDVIRRGDGNIHEVNEGDGDEFDWSHGSEEGPPDHEVDESDEIGMGQSPCLQLEIDEADVEEGRARWAQMAVDLVGPPGLVLPQFEKSSSSLWDPDRRDVGDIQPVASGSCAEVRWDPDIGSSRDHPSRPPTISGKHGRSGSMVPTAPPPGPGSISKSKPKKDPPSAWWYGPPPHRGPPPPVNYTTLRFAPPPPHFSSWYPGVRAGHMQEHGYWYGTPMNGTSSSAHTFPSPTSTRPGQSSRHHGKAGSNRDEYGPGAEGDKETDTDHGYESTATTTDSDPPPHTPIGIPTTSHYGGTPQVRGDDDVDVHGIEIDEEHASASYTTPGSSDPTTPIKIPGRSQVPFCSMTTSPMTSMGSPVSSVDCYQPSNAAVVFPSLNGSFRQGSLYHPPASSSSEGVATRSMPARSMTPVCSSSSLDAVEVADHMGLSISPGNEVSSKVKPKTRSPEPSSSSHASPAVTLNACSPPPTSPSPGLRKDSQGFWEPVTPISPSSSLSSLPSEGKANSRSSAGWIGEKTVRALVIGEESMEGSGYSVVSSSSSSSSKARSLSPDRRDVVSVGSTRSSSSTPTSVSSPSPTSASSHGVMHASSASPSPDPAMLSPNPNPTTLLPAFMANAAAKKKRMSRTREIVDRLRSSSIDAGKGGVGSDSLGWLAGSSGEIEPVLGKAVEVTAVREQASPSPSPSPPSKSAQTKVQGQVMGSKGSVGTTSSTAVASSSVVPSSGTVQRPSATTNDAPTPFPILSVPKSSKPATTCQNPSKGTTGLESATSSHSKDKSRVNGTVAISPIASGTSPQRPNGTNTTSPHHPPHPSLPSPSYATGHPPPPLGPPPMIAVPTPYVQPVYMPFAQYQQAQGAWLVYRPPTLPVHPHPVQTHVAPITGASGMRHVSW